MQWAKRGAQFADKHDVDLVVNTGARAFADDLRRGGYRGETVSLPADKPIDDLLRDRAFKRGFLRTDNLKVLDGAAETLARCVGAQVTVPVSALASVVRRMEGAGFAIADTVPVATYRDDPAAASEFDCVFRREP